MAVSKPTMITKFHTKSKYHRPTTKRTKTTKIAWHYTGKAEVPALNTWKYFENSTAYASAHFICGLEGEIYYAVPMNEIAYTSNSANSYSIGIECATTGTDDHYSDAEYKSMVKLGAWLAQEYDLDPRKDFIRHYDVTGKICPRYFVNNSKKWEQFKLDCYNYMTGKLKDSGIRNCTNGKGNSVLEEEFKQYIVRTTAETLNARKGAGTSYDIECKLTKGTAVTIVAEKKVSTTKWLKTKSGYWISSKYTEFVKYV